MQTGQEASVAYSAAERFSLLVKVLQGFLVKAGHWGRSLGCQPDYISGAAGVSRSEGTTAACHRWSSPDVQAFFLLAACFHFHEAA